MNRRSFFRALVPTVAVAAVPPPTPERAMTLTAPCCPRCGLMMLFERRQAYPGEPVPTQCSCGFRTLCPTMTPVR